MSFFDELKRRSVYRVGIAYILVSWVVLQVADVILGNIDVPGWIFKVILLVLAIGFPVAMVLAWAFELTPQGLKREEEVDRSKSVAANNNHRKLDFAIIGLLVIALGYFGYDKFVLSTNPQTGLVGDTTQSAGDGTVSESGIAEDIDRSIAVLPFRNVGDDVSQEYFADGLAEELLNLLARIPVLRVIARTSSFSFKGKAATIDEVSRELNVNFVLQGSVRKSGENVRVIAQLVRASDSSYLWSQDYERRELDDIFQIQDDIARAVVAQLRLKLLDTVPKSEETDPAAYALYLQARALSRQSTKEGHERSIELLEKALDIAEGYAPAWAGLAENYISLADRILTDVNEGFAKARDAANKALAIDPNHAAAHGSLGWIAMVHDHDLVDASQHLQTALAMDPANPQIVRQAATFSMNLGRLDEAIALMEFGVARDPVVSALYSNLGLAYFSAGRPDDAITAYSTALSLSPDAIGLHSFIGQALLSKNEPAAAIEAMNEEASEPWRLIGLIMAYHAMGQAAESDATLAEMIDKYGDEWPYNISYALAYRGETDRTFDWLNRAKVSKDPGLSEVVVAPEFDNVRTDARWLPFLESIDKAPRQLGAIRFEIADLNSN